MVTKSRRAAFAGLAWLAAWRGPDSECIHHEAGGITPEKVFHAMLAADAIGEYRKKQSNS